MIESEPSRTAMMTAMARAAHRLLDDRPWLVDDPFGMLLIGPRWREVFDAKASGYTPDMMAEIRAFVAARARYAEDRLEAGDFSQYVILGAGLDSFVWRRPDLCRRLKVFEVDHPATQEWKRKRAEALALPTPKSVVYAAVNFEKETLSDGLSRAGFDWSAKTFFIWTGVTMYISIAASEATLKTVARCAKGSEIAFTYAPDNAQLDARALEMRSAFVRIATAAGEPPLTTFSEDELGALVRGAGMTIVDHPTFEDFHERYFSSRKDGLKAYQLERIVTAQSAF
jgi:methyltransferase (TIGR00027 family)